MKKIVLLTTIMLYAFLSIQASARDLQNLPEYSNTHIAGIGSVLYDENERSGFIKFYNPTTSRQETLSKIKKFERSSGKHLNFWIPEWDFTFHVGGAIEKKYIGFWFESR